MNGIKKFNSIVRTQMARITPVKRFMSSEATHAIEPYANGVKFMHWAMGGAVIGCVACVQLAQNTPKGQGKTKGQYMFLHKSFGTLAAGLLVPRLAVRLATKAPPAFSKVAWQKALGMASHAAMYGFLIVMPVTGVAMGYYGGKGLPFFWTTLPGAENKDGKTAGQAFKLHKQFGWYMEMLLLGHIGAAGYHTAMGHKILPRILPMAR
jgi:cytochrome b561